MKEKIAVITGIGSLVAATLASICCLGPLVFTALGVGGFGLAAGLEKYRTIFLVLTSALLAGAFYFIYRKREVVCADGSCRLQTAGSKTMKILLWIITGATLLLAAFPYYSATLAGRELGPVNTRQSDARRFNQGG